MYIRRILMFKNPSLVAFAYYVTAVLVILPGTFPLRLALLPVTLWLAFRAVTSIDVGAGLFGSDPRYEFLGYGLGVSHCILELRFTILILC